MEEITVEEQKEAINRLASDGTLSVCTLTGNKTLRDKATLENVTVSGILYLTDMLSLNGITPPLVMINALEQLLKSKGRLAYKS